MCLGFWFCHSLPGGRRQGRLIAQSLCDDCQVVTWCGCCVIGCRSTSKKHRDVQNRNAAWVCSIIERHPVHRPHKLCISDVWDHPARVGRNHQRGAENHRVMSKPWAHWCRQSPFLEVRFAEVCAITPICVVPRILVFYCENDAGRTQAALAPHRASTGSRSWVLSCRRMMPCT